MRVLPQPPRRIGDADAVEQAQRLVLGGVAYAARFARAIGIAGAESDAVSRLATLTIMTSEDVLRIRERLRLSNAATRRLETISPEAPVSALMPIFRADRVVIVVDKAGKYFGLITKIDMINYLRQQLVR